MTPNIPRRWDTYDAYLFDLDGTLLHCTDAVHYFAFCDTLSMVAGRPLNLDGVSTHGSVDVAILADAFAVGGVQEDCWRPRLAEIRQSMCARVKQNESDLRIEVLPSAEEILRHLDEGGAILGTATGNLEEIGVTKLNRCGLLKYFDFGGYSDLYETRAEVFRAAVHKALALTKPDAAICVFGDTPADIRAAQANGIDSIAVATGIFSFDELAKLKPTRCLHTLTNLLSS